MRFVGVLALCAFVTLVSAQSKPFYKISDAPQLFKKFIKDFGKKYKNAADRLEHYKAFVASLKFINKWNADPTETATYGIGPMIDIPEKKWRKWGYKKKFPKV